MDLQFHQAIYLICEYRTKAEGYWSEQRSVVEDTETYARTTVGHAIPAKIEVLDRQGKAICEEDYLQIYRVSQV